MTFQAGYAKMYSNYAKQYHPLLYRNKQRRYAGHGKIHFRSASKAMQYAMRWAKRVEKILQEREEKP